MDIQWYPGHMAKAKRQLADKLKVIDAVVELADARAPMATRNPDFEALFAQKPRLLILNKADLANDGETRRWIEHFRKNGLPAMALSCVGSKGLKEVFSAVEALTRDKVAAMAQKGVRKTVRAMVVGIPNVGKSTFINKLRGRAAAKAADKPGVTRGNQWIIIGPYLEFLDTPGLLWPKLEDQDAAMRLAFIGSVRDEVINQEELACRFLRFMTQASPAMLVQRYKLTDLSAAQDHVLLEQACRGRGWLLSGGRFDYERGAKVILDEFRAGKLGKLTIERAPDENG